MTDTPHLTEDPRVDDARAFALYWQKLLADSEGFRDCAAAPATTLGFLTFADFREAMQQAFLAGRASQ